MERPGLIGSFRNMAGWLVSVFVVSTMVNVGLTQQPSAVAMLTVANTLGLVMLLFLARTLRHDNAAAEAAAASQGRPEQYDDPRDTT